MNPSAHAALDEVIEAFAPVQWRQRRVEVRQLLARERAPNKVGQHWADLRDRLLGLRVERSLYRFDSIVVSVIHARAEFRAVGDQIRPERARGRWPRELWRERQALGSPESMARMKNALSELRRPEDRANFLLEPLATYEVVYPDADPSVVALRVEHRFSITRGQVLSGRLAPGRGNRLRAVVEDLVDSHRIVLMHALTGDPWDGDNSPDRGDGPDRGGPLGLPATVAQELAADILRWFIGDDVSATTIRNEWGAWLRTARTPLPSGPLDLDVH